MTEDKSLNLIIKNSHCIMCGKEITNLDRIKSHLLPKRLKPKGNVIVFLHKDCEKRINSLYINQQKKTEGEKVKKKALNLIKDLETKLNIIKNKIQNEKI